MARGVGLLFALGRLPGRRRAAAQPRDGARDADGQQARRRGLPQHRAAERDAARVVGRAARAPLRDAADDAQAVGHGEERARREAHDPRLAVDERPALERRQERGGARGVEAALHRGQRPHEPRGAVAAGRLEGDVDHSQRGGRRGGRARPRRAGRRRRLCRGGGVDALLQLLADGARGARGGIKEGARQPLLLQRRARRCALRRRAAAPAARLLWAVIPAVVALVLAARGVGQHRLRINRGEVKRAGQHAQHARRGGGVAAAPRPRRGRREALAEAARAVLGGAEDGDQGGPPQPTRTRTPGRRRRPRTPPRLAAHRLSRRAPWPGWAHCYHHPRYRHPPCCLTVRGWPRSLAGLIALAPGDSDE
ncbi:MAG: hypothetical protein J3K34DRAFT_425243 [Monoraphidium minutum]|nr:MAG: hypothetical protein J3K34DRAFT_425243 [Monoraphidium minutum]